VPYALKPKRVVYYTLVVWSARLSKGYFNSGHNKEDFFRRAFGVLFMVFLKGLIFDIEDIKIP